MRTVWTVTKWWKYESDVVVAIYASEQLALDHVGARKKELPPTRTYNIVDNSPGKHWNFELVELPGKCPTCGAPMDGDAKEEGYYIEACDVRETVGGDHD